MPQKADAVIAPSIEIDVDEKYVLEVIDITESPSQWENAREGQMSLTWKFRVYDQDTGAAVLDNNSGFAYELWNFTPDTTYKNTKTGKTAKAREWTEALLGRELTDAEMNDLIDLGFADSLKGKRGVADLEWYITKGGNERLKVIRLRPYKKGKPAAAPATAPDDRAARRAALGLDDNELPS